MDGSKLIQKIYDKIMKSILRRLQADVDAKNNLLNAHLAKYYAICQY